MDNSGDKIIYLADRLDLIPILGGWFYKEWGRNLPDVTQATFEGKLRQRLNRDQVPLVLVTLRDDSPIASASLKIQEMETHPQYLHWLGSVYVLPEYREEGIGTKLVQFAVNEAKRLAVHDLYLYTRNRENFYTRLGWKVLERPLYHGREVVIMEQILSV